MIPEEISPLSEEKKMRCIGRKISHDDKRETILVRWSSDVDQEYAFSSVPQVVRDCPVGWNVHAEFQSGINEWVTAWCDSPYPTDPTDAEVISDDMTASVSLASIDDTEEFLREQFAAIVRKHLEH